MEEYEFTGSSRSHVSITSSLEGREQWSDQLDFLLSCLGYAVGLSNMWRFPYLAYKSGGGAFLIPYTVMLIFACFPIFVLELTLGQFTSCGPTTCWDFCPMFEGCGVAMAIVSGLCAMYYNVIISWAIFLFVASFSSDVPWRECGEWSTRFCSERVRYLNKTQCVLEQAFIAPNGTCVPPGDPDAIWIYNRTLAKQFNIKLTFAAMEYFERRVTGSDFGDISDIGPLRWDLVLCLFVCWVIVFLCLAKGIKTSGKIVYLTATSPYLILSVLLARGLHLDGATEGVAFYVSPDPEVLKSAQVWKDAAAQVFFSSSASYGGLITLSSYNKFKSDLLRDSILVTFGDSLTSVFSGFVVFSYLGFLAKHQDVSFDVVATQGPSLAFGVYPFSLTKLPGSSFWSGFFFLMLLFLGLDSQFVFVETVATSVVDSWPKLRYRKWRTMLVLCCIFFVGGLPMTTNGGVDIVELLDNYAGGLTVLITSVCECIAVGWLYGTTRFLQDMQLMVGDKFFGCCHFQGLWTFWWMLCWKFISPSLSMFVILFSWIDYQRIERFPLWADGFGWAITFTGIFSIVGWGCYNFYRVEAIGWREKIWVITRPNKYWGPARKAHRKLVLEYVPDFVVNPDAEEIPKEERKERKESGAETAATERVEGFLESERLNSKQNNIV